MKEKTELDKKIEKLEKELQTLKLERDYSNSGIKPSETEALIKKWYGHVISFDCVEYGGIDILIESIKVDRTNQKIWVEGNLLIFVTPDTSFLSNIKQWNIQAYPYGGRLLLQGKIDIESITYVPKLDWSEPIAAQLDELFTDHEISNKNFSEDIKEADDCCDNFDYPEYNKDTVLKYNTEKADDSYDYCLLKKYIFNEL